jgi:hypothetical protein
MIRHRREAARKPHDRASDRDSARLTQGRRAPRGSACELGLAGRQAALSQWHENRAHLIRCVLLQLTFQLVNFGEFRQGVV